MAAQNQFHFVPTPYKLLIICLDATHSLKLENSQLKLRYLLICSISLFLCLFIDTHISWNQNEIVFFSLLPPHKKNLNNINHTFQTGIGNKNFYFTLSKGLKILESVGMFLPPFHPLPS